MCLCVCVCPIIISALIRNPDVRVRDVPDARRDADGVLLDERGSAHERLLSLDRESLCGLGI